MCTPNPCENGGECYINNNAVECYCPPTWSGPTCAIPSMMGTTTTVAPGR